MILSSGRRSDLAWTCTVGGCVADLVNGRNELVEALDTSVVDVLSDSTSCYHTDMRLKFKMKFGTVTQLGPRGRLVHYKFEI